MNSPRRFRGTLRKLWNRVRRRRTIEVPQSGRWFLALTIVFGVAAVLSGNGVLYLLESLLLGFLILSGVLSDRMLWNLSVRWIEQPVHAQGPLSDRIVVTNRSRIPAMAVEFGEWTDRGFEIRAYLPSLAGRSRGEAILLDRPYSRRGIHEWTGKVMATRFPFGFARKIRWIDGDGERWIRPAIDSSLARSLENAADAGSGADASRPGSENLLEGAVRPHLPGEDPRDIAWVYSSSLLGPHVQRLRGQSSEPVLLRLDTSIRNPAKWEAHLSDLATHIVHAERAGSPIELEIPANRPTTIHEVEPALDFLARLPAPGDSPGGPA